MRDNATHIHVKTKHVCRGLVGTIVDLNVVLIPQSCKKCELAVYCARKEYMEKPYWQGIWPRHPICAAPNTNAPKNLVNWINAH
jgi:hypothetical protein